MSQPFTPNLQNIINSKPLKLERLFTQHPMSHVRCYISCVTCHMSCVTCHVSHVTCHMSHVTFYFIFIHNIFCYGQSGEASWWMVCYQRGLACLVLFEETWKIYVLSLCLTVTILDQSNKNREMFFHHVMSCYFLQTSSVFAPPTIRNPCVRHLNGSVTLVIKGEQHIYIYTYTLTRIDNLQ